MNILDDWPEDLHTAFERRREAFWTEPGAQDAYENHDSERACRVGNVDEERVFKEIADAGCCGSHEVEWEFDVPSGKATVRYGFNHGH